MISPVKTMSSRAVVRRCAMSSKPLTVLYGRLHSHTFHHTAVKVLKLQGIIVFICRPNSLFGKVSVGVSREHSRGDWQTLDVGTACQSCRRDHSRVVTQLDPLLLRAYVHAGVDRQHLVLARLDGQITWRHSHSPPERSQSRHFGQNKTMRWATNSLLEQDRNEVPPPIGKGRDDAQRDPKQLPHETDVMRRDVKPAGANVMGYR